VHLRLFGIIVDLRRGIEKGKTLLGYRRVLELRKVGIARYEDSGLKQKKLLLMKVWA